MHHHQPEPSMQDAQGQADALTQPQAAAPELQFEDTLSVVPWGDAAHG